MRRAKSASHPFFAAPLLVFVISVFVLLLRLVDLANVSELSFYIIMIALQAVIFGVPSAAFCVFRQKGYLSALNLYFPGKRTISVTIFGTLFLILLSCVLKFGLFHFAYDASAYSLYGSSISVKTDSFVSGIFMVIALAVMPAVTEEFVFRGVIMREYRMGGSLFSMLMSALLFAFIHFDIKQFPVYFVLGLVLAWLVFLTHSLWTSVIAHMIYNLFEIFLEKYIWLFSSNPDSDILFWLILIAIMLVCAFFFISSAERILRYYAEIGEEAQAPVDKSKLAFMLYDVFTSVPLLAETLLFLVFGIIFLFLT